MSNIPENFPFEVKEDKNEVLGTFKIVYVGPKNYVLPSVFPEEYDTAYNFDFRKEDVIVTGLARSGTTITQEMIWLIGNDLNFEKASKTVLDHRVVCLDHYLYHARDLFPKGNKQKTDYEEVKQKYLDVHKKVIESPGRRYFKTHVPLSLLPKMLSAGCKIIYCARNPKDVCISHWHVRKLFEGKEDPFENTWEKFQNNQILYTPYFEHVKEGWKRRNDSNVLFLFYEDTVKDKRAAFKKIADFLGKTLTEDDLDKLEDHFNIDKFRNNKSVNKDHLLGSVINNKTKENEFIRKGQAGGWRNYFSEELNEKADRWIENNLKLTDLVLPKY